MIIPSGPDWSHQSGQSWATTTWTVDKVLAAPDPLIGFANYMEQILGVGFPTVKDLTILRKRVHEIFDRYPKADFRTMCRLVQYNKNKKKKFTKVYAVTGSFRDAMAAGWLPELTNENDENLREDVLRILKTETDPDWRGRLLACPDDDSRRFVITEYKNRNAA